MHSRVGWDRRIPPLCRRGRVRRPHPTSYWPFPARIFARRDRGRSGPTGRPGGVLRSGGPPRRGVGLAGPGGRTHPLRNHAGANPPWVVNYNAILRSAALAARLKPEVVLGLGDWPTSKQLRQWLQSADAESGSSRPDSRNHDPLHGRTRQLRGSVQALAAEFPRAGANPRPTRRMAPRRPGRRRGPRRPALGARFFLRGQVPAGCSPSTCRRERRFSSPAACRCGMSNSSGGRTTGGCRPVFQPGRQRHRWHAVDRARSGARQPAGGVADGRSGPAARHEWFPAATEVAGQPDDRADQQPRRRHLRNAARGESSTRPSRSFSPRRRRWISDDSCSAYGAEPCAGARPGAFGRADLGTAENRSARPGGADRPQARCGACAGSCSVRRRRRLKRRGSGADSVGVGAPLAGGLFPRQRMARASPSTRSGP